MKRGNHLTKAMSLIQSLLMFACSYLAVPAQVLADGLALQDAVRFSFRSSFCVF